MKLIDEEYIQVKSEMQNILYKIAINSLMYAMVAKRVDVIFSVSVVSQHIFK